MDSIDRRTRGAAHGPDHEVLMRALAARRLRPPTGSGYAYVEPGGGVALLAATNRRTATGCSGRRWPRPTGRREIGHVTAANEWAVDVGMAARLELHQEGYLALRNMKPPAPYLHNGTFL